MRELILPKAQATGAHQKEVNISAEQPSAGVSVVVCCHNSSERLEATLRHLAVQITRTRLSLEIVLIDNASTDGTASTARGSWTKLGAPFPLRILCEEKIGLSNARWTGILAASHDVVVFCDDDNWLSPDYCLRASEIMGSAADVVAAGGCSGPVFDEGVTPPEWFYGECAGYAVGTQAQRSGDVTETRGFLWGAGLIVRRERLLHLRDLGFLQTNTGRRGSELSSGDDSELCLALAILGGRLYYSESLRFRHYIPLNRLSEPYRKELQTGFSVATVVLQNYRYALSYVSATRWAIIRKLIALSVRTLSGSKNTRSELIRLTKFCVGRSDLIGAGGANLQRLISQRRSTSWGFR